MGRTTKEWPGAEAAFAFVLPSYQMLMTRFEAADNRIAAVLNIATVITSAAPVVVKSIRPEIAFNSPWFIAAVSFFLLAAGIAITGRSQGRLALPDPAVFHDQWLTKSDEQFRVDALHFAGEAFDQNAKTIARKGIASNAVAGLFVLEVLLLIVWFAR